MGVFDDLIPAGQQAPSTGGVFDDLIPKQASQFDDLVSRTSPRAGVLETAGLIGTQLLDALTHHLPGAVAATYEGSEPSTGFAGSMVERSRAKAQERSAEVGKGPTMIPGVGREDIAGLGPSIAFSVPPMVGGLAAGVPAAAAGAMAGPVGSAVAGYSAGMGAAGTIAYRQATNQFVRDLRDSVNQDRKQTGQGPISDEEFKTKSEQLAPLIREYGLWEAVPEAAGSALGFGILRAPVKEGIGRVFGNGVATRLGAKAAALYGEELATETVTQQGQHNVELAAGMKKGEQPRSWTSPSDIATSFGEIAPLTALQTTLLAGGAKLAGIRSRPDTAPPTQEEISQVGDALRAPGQEAVFGVEPPPVMGPQEYGAVPPEIATPTTFPASPTPPATGEMAPEAVKFLAEQQAKEAAKAAPLEAMAQARVEPALEETHLASPGANIGRLSLLMGANLYGKPEQIAAVSIKEMLQNSFDAMKGLLKGKTLEQGRINFDIDTNNRTLTVTDNGAGMTPDIMGGAFLRIADTHKETEQSSGGFGIAKMLYLFGNKRLLVTSMRGGKVYTMRTSGPELLASANEPGNDALRPQIRAVQPSREDIAAFPEGHGTRITVEVPQSYRDPSTGEQREIPFSDYMGDYPALRSSPLFHDIDVRVNGVSVPGIGADFDHSRFTQFANVHFDWGSAHIYVSKTKEAAPYSGNAKVLSNGLWQFDQRIMKDPLKSYGEQIERNFYIDVSPNVKPEDAGYPFDLNRQGFSRAVKGDFEKIFNYMSLLYKQDDLQGAAINYGSIQYLSRDEGGVFASSALEIKPKVPPKSTAVNLIRPGDEVSVEDGKLIVNGRRIPELTNKDLEELKDVDTESLIVDQSEIDPDQVILHDNIDVSISALETRSLVELVRERFGERFDSYAQAMGAHFLELRNVIADTVPRYRGLREEGIGISFDEEYHGVSIRVPFAASFLNIAVPHETGSPHMAAVSMVWTMLHELGHHIHRSEDGLGPVIQQLATYLDLHKTFDFQHFKQQVINTVADHEKVFRYLHGVMTSGTFPVQPRGKRLETTGSFQGRDASSIGDDERTGRPREGAATGSGVEGGATPSRGIGIGAGVSLKISSTSHDRTNGRAANQRALNDDAPGIPAAERQPEIAYIARNIETLYSKVAGGTPKPIKTFAAHADRMNRFYKWAAGLDQLIKGNPNFIPLLQYGERIRLMHNEEATIHDAAIRVGKRWRSLGTRGDNLAALFDDMANMRFLSPAEAAVNTIRQPSNAELSALLTKHKIDAETLKVFNDVRAMFDSFLSIVEGNAIQAATRILSDPVKLADKIDSIRAQIKELRAKPYFPFIRFGRHYVMVKNAANRVVKFETFERRGLVSAEAQQKRAYEAAQKAKAVDEVVTPGLLPENASPFVGMPPPLLEMIKSELGLTQDQIAALEQIQLRQAPELSFKRLMKSEYIPGYSMDFKRAFARYFFHGGKYHARTKFGHALRGDIATARASIGPTVTTANKAGLIADYMQDHLDNTILDAKGDFGIFKGAIFLWAMGYVPAAAAQNLSQTPMITLPYLGGKFGPPGIGDARAVAAITKAMANVTNFYKKGSYDKIDSFAARALSYGIKTGRISETQAPELAGMSAQGNLFQGIAGNFLQRGSIHMMEKAAWMFEMAEQFNRRVAYRAALSLAMRHPNAKAVKEALRTYSNEYHTLIANGIDGKTVTPQQAAAIVTAAHVVDETQFIYARYARPRIFRGRIPGTLFVFKKYMQSVLFMLGQNKADVLPRYLIVAALLGGLGGMPGYDDFRDILRAIALWLFGKDFNLDREVRKYVTQYTDGTIPPDIMLHGLSRIGFGLPAVLDMMGQNPGRGLQSGGHSQNVPFPVLDRSRALSMGNILPVEIGKLMTPQKDVNSTIAEQTQKASGAVFSVGFNLYKALQDNSNEWGDFKRWEKAMPRALMSASRSYRAFSEGRERGKGGPNSAPTLVPFDVRDTEQMMEALAMAAGYQPLRLQAKWDSILAKVEVEKFYDMKRSALLQQNFEAVSGKIPQEIKAVLSDIRKFNQELPTWAKGKLIQAETLESSFGARQRAKVSKESGIPTQVGNVGISRYIDTLFPETVVDVRRVRQ